MSVVIDFDVEGLRRRIRIVMILHACSDGGLAPATGAAVHTVAYLCDVLSPVWDLPLLDSQILKSWTAPRFPALQRDLDRLVGSAVVTVAPPIRKGRSRPAKGIDKDSTVYSLTPLAAPIVSQLQEQSSQIGTFRFVREVVLALSGLDPVQLGTVSSVDLAYSDPNVDVNGLLDLGGSAYPNHGAAAAFRFRDVVPDGADLSDTQLVHLYVRHLYRRMHVA